MIGALVAAAIALSGMVLRPRPGVRCIAARRTALSRPRRVSAAALDGDLAQAIELVVLAVRAGHLPSSAVRVVLPHLAPTVAPAFAAVVARIDGGARFADALGELSAALGPPATGFADALAAADRYGLPLAPVLDRLADEARRRRRRHHEVLARQLPVRMAMPLVLCTLPSFVLVAIVPLLLAAFSSLHR